MTTEETIFSTLEDRPLLDMARRLATEERRATAALLRALMEIDARRLYLGEGCASMFVYCTQMLRLAEGAAYNRIEAARAARDFPLILELFEQSAITLTAVRLLAPHLSAENHVAVLASARHKSKREVEELVAALRPKPDAPSVVRKLPEARSSAERLVSTPGPPCDSRLVPHASCASEPIAAPLATMPAAHRATSTPLAPGRYLIQLTVSRETHEKFRRAQSLLRHALPSGDASEIFDRALTLLVERLEQQRFAETSRPRGLKQSSQRSRHIPAAVRRDVWQRDGGRCAFVGASGRCHETSWLEFHHVEPYAAGGAATPENIELRCRAHNAHEARLFFGDNFIRERWIAWDHGLM